MSNPTPTYEPAVADIYAYMAARKVAYAEARFALIKAHLPAARPAVPGGVAVPHTLTAAAFIARVPVEVWAKVKSARQGTTPLAVALDQAVSQLEAEPSVTADNPQLLAMLAQLTAAGIITADDEKQILSF